MLVCHAANLVSELDRRAHDHCRRGLGAECLEHRHKLLWAVHPYPEHDGMLGVDRLVDRVVDAHPAHVLTLVDMTVSDLEQGHAEVVEHSPKTEPRESRFLGGAHEGKHSVVR